MTGAHHCTGYNIQSYIVAVLERGRDRPIDRPRWAMSPRGSADQGVAHGQRRNAREVSVGRPQFGHTVREADGGDARIVNCAALHLGGQRQWLQALQVVIGFGDEGEAGQGVQRAQLRKRRCRRRGGFVDARMRHDGEELVCARPGDGPRPAPGGERFKC